MNDKLTSKANREALTWHGLKSGVMVAHNISHYYTQVKLLTQYICPMGYGIHSRWTRGRWTSLVGIGITHMLQFIG